MKIIQFILSILFSIIFAPNSFAKDSIEFKFKSAIDQKELKAKIYFPAKAPQPVPFLVITNSSSCGSDRNFEDIPRLASGLPFAIVALDSCGPRGVWGIGKNPYSVPIKSQVIDVASLVNALNDFPALDINNWGITGHSRGGRVTLSLSHKQRWKYIVEEFPSLKTLYPRVGVATSPLCIAPKESDLVVQSLHIISTEKDDQHYSECKNLVDQRKNQNPNINVSFELYEGLNHDFSSDAGEYLGAAFRIKNECFPLYEVNKDFLGGEIAGIVMSEQEASRKCIKRGAYIGGNYAKWEQSRIRVLEVASSILSHRR